MSKHTPGPWCAFANDIAIGVTTQESDVAWTFHSAKGPLDGRRSRNEDIANACLIAAAPELLEALKETVDAYCHANCPSVWKHEDGQPHTEQCKRNHAAIVKAEGRT